MSHQKQVCIWCDDENCANYVRYETNSVRTATQFARSDGWTSSIYGRHICPECSQ